MVLTNKEDVLRDIPLEKQEEKRSRTRIRRLCSKAYPDRNRKFINLCWVCQRITVLKRNSN
ncbi:hypothetical protein KHA80_00005 [Anaerobacillus sp. HL2]|nr:hypothetical protein KHA80_00005 [Anaerobacillus sp. HL2]